MDQGERKPPDLSVLMNTVAAIVESVLERQGVVLSTQPPNRWKAAHREAMARDQRWRTLGWTRA